MRRRESPVVHFDDVGGYDRLMNNFKKNFRDENWLEKECNADIILKKRRGWKLR